MRSTCAGWTHCPKTCLLFSWCAATTRVSSPSTPNVPAPTTFPQHSHNIPTTFPQHSHMVAIKNTSLHMIFSPWSNKDSPFIKAMMPTGLQSTLKISFNQGCSVKVYDGLITLFVSHWMMLLCQMAME